jgi:DNA mismatch endonuclease, patch repair protein
MAWTVPDNLTPNQRSLCMSRNKGKDTGLELMVRSELHRLGLRFRKHAKELPGCPDVVFTKAKVAIFTDGDFWHGYRYPTWKDTLSPFWQAKIEANRARDRSNHRKLRRLGWTVIRLWEHQIEREPDRYIAAIAEGLSRLGSRIPKGRIC